MTNTETTPARPEDVKYDDRGLVVAIAQDDLTGRVQMVAWMNTEALAATLRSGRATFYSRSRKTIWIKGESSGNTLEVHSVHIDCDGDTLLLLTRPVGPSCHTGAPTCFFRRVLEDGERDHEQQSMGVAAPVLHDLEAEIVARKTAGDARASYTRSLLERGADAIGAKIREEAEELARAIASEDPARVAAEGADLVYHLLVGLAYRDVPLATLLSELRRRRGVSGLTEKATRG